MRVCVRTPGGTIEVHNMHIRGFQRHFSILLITNHTYPKRKMVSSSSNSVVRNPLLYGPYATGRCTNGPRVLPSGGVKPAGKAMHKPSGRCFIAETGTNTGKLVMRTPMFGTIKTLPVDKKDRESTEGQNAVMLFDIYNLQNTTLSFNNWIKTMSLKELYSTISISGSATRSTRLGTTRT